MTDTVTTLYAIAEAARRMVEVARALLRVGTDPAEPYDRLFACFWEAAQALEKQAKLDAIPRNHPARKDVARLLPRVVPRGLEDRLRRLFALHDEVLGACRVDGQVRIVERSDRYVAAAAPLRILDVLPETLDKMLAAAEDVERVLEAVNVVPQAAPAVDGDGSPPAHEWDKLPLGAKKVAEFLHKEGNRLRPFKGVVLANKVGLAYDYVRSLMARLIELGFVTKTEDGYTAGRVKPPR